MKKYLLLAMLVALSIGIKAQPKTDNITEDTTIYAAVEISPSFPGGEKAMMAFLKKNLRYPEIDKQNNTQGAAYVQFVVEKNGSVTNVNVVRAQSETIRAEARRLIQAMPNWSPGSHNGKVVRVQYIVPIRFVL